MYYDDGYVDIDGRDSNGNLVAGLGVGNDYQEVVDCSEPYYQYEFSNLESLVASRVFQEQLSMALAHKQQEIDSLRKELLKCIEEEHNGNNV